MRKFLWFTFGFFTALVVVAGLVWGPFRSIGAPNPVLRPTMTPMPPAPVAEPTARPTQAPAHPALNWQREGGLAGRCERLTVDEQGRAYYAPCGEGRRVAQLSSDEFRAYLVYVARYAPMEVELQDNPGRADNMTVRLSFVGRGSRKPTEAEQAELAQWASDVYQRLATEEQRADIVARARSHLAERLGIYTDAIETRSVEAVDWPDACLGVTAKGVFCAQVVTPGYRIVLAFDGTDYEYRSDRYEMVRPVGQS